MTPKPRIRAVDGPEPTPPPASDRGDEPRVVALVRPGRRERLGLPRIAAAMDCPVSLRWVPLEGALAPSSGVARGDLAPGTFDAETLLDRTATRAEGSAGVTSGHAYPGMCLASQVARRLGLPGPSPGVVLQAEHKLYARRAMARLVPEATPRFAALDPDTWDGAPPLPFPFFLKPVKSSFSAGARTIRDAVELREAVGAARARRRDYVAPLEAWLLAETDLEPSAHGLVAEELLAGHQVSIEGRMSRGRFEVLGVLDAEFYGDSLAFESFVLPSRLPHGVQERMVDIARRLLEGLGYDDAPWNLEMRWDPATDRIGIVEMNPKIASQFVDLFEWVAGVSGWEVLLRTALGELLPSRRSWHSLPGADGSERSGRWRCAGSFPLRRFGDARVLAAPSAERIAELEAAGGLAIEVQVSEGERLSESGGLQDGCSYRYAVVNLAADDREQLDHRLAEVTAALGFRFEDSGQ